VSTSACSWDERILELSCGFIPGQVIAVAAMVH
jgi:hypothetical protein